MLTYTLYTGCRQWFMSTSRKINQTQYVCICFSLTFFLLCLSIQNVWPLFFATSAWNHLEKFQYWNNHRLVFFVTIQMVQSICGSGLFLTSPTHVQHRLSTIILPCLCPCDAYDGCQVHLVENFTSASEFPNGWTSIGFTPFVSSSSCSITLHLLKPLWLISLEECIFFPDIDLYHHPILLLLQWHQFFD